MGELGLMDTNDGIRFFRDPKSLSWVDELDQNRKQGKGLKYPKRSLLRPDDFHIATDYMLLLLQQMIPCRFKISDQRGGPGSRRRDRALGFPGLACIHCAKRNNYGRYFPVASKTLVDATANSIISHMSNCSYCPKSIQASLAYLHHRSSFQKYELGNGWKKTFFKKIWDRLHVERAWLQPHNDVLSARKDDDKDVHSVSDDETTVSSIDKTYRKKRVAWIHGSGDDESQSSLSSDMEENTIVHEATARKDKDTSMQSGWSQKLQKGCRGWKLPTIKVSK